MMRTNSYQAMSEPMNAARSPRPVDTARRGVGRRGGVSPTGTGRAMAALRTVSPGAAAFARRSPLWLGCAKRGMAKSGTAPAVTVTQKR